ncbi:ATP-binding cassette sub-family C member 5-like [Ischnura elegans]|uniref:ATP-binding cassette sub-family C member 5-like n=1 Tax=Ischnura elegans TaxID=197161 RepID=UPI001ED8888B|nr:ATP-binding cassette sub-family C member 5-like [Ischnura elegans]
MARDDGTDEVAGDGGMMGRFELTPGVHIATSASKAELNRRSDEALYFEEYIKKQGWSKKYGQALRNLIPIRKSKRKESRHLPSSDAGCLSFVSSSWLSPLMFKAFRKGISTEDVWDLSKKDSAKYNASRLTHFWEEEIKVKGSNKASLARAVWRFSRTRLLWATVLMILTNAFQFLGPAWVQNELLIFVENENEPQSWGLVLVALLLVSQCLRTLCFNTMWIVGYHTAIRVMGSLQYMVYQKLLKMRSPNDQLLGKVVNMCTNDQERLCEAVAAGVLIIGAPAISLMSMVYSFFILGPWALLGNFILIAFTPVSMGIAKLTNKIRTSSVKLSDERVTLTNKVLANIKLIKMYAWERSFFKKIMEVRNKEHKKLKLALFLQSLGSTLTPSSATLATVATFLGYTLAGNNLKPTDAFAVFSIFNAVLFSMGRLPYAIRCIGEAKVCLHRVKEYLDGPEFSSQNDSSSLSPSSAIEFVGTKFAWEGPPNSSRKTKAKGKRKYTAVVASNENSHTFTAVLFDITLTVGRGSLFGVCGGVGSGKSSLLSALIGELKLLDGTMRVMAGGIAYVTQQAWIFNDTLKENILFGLPYDSKRYRATIEACGLSRDLELLSNGDLTEVGENGFNLSGGQKQRINLARAVYSNQEIYLLDDPLSAVDAKVAAHIFQHCINGLLKEKTVILATHSIRALLECDTVVVLRDGIITENGTPEELMKKEGGEFSVMVKECMMESYPTHAGTTEKKVEASTHAEFSSDECFIPQMKSEKHLPKSIDNSFRRYLIMCGGYCVSFLSASAMILFALVRLFNSIWLQTWLDAGNGQNFQLLSGNRSAPTREQNFSLPQSHEWSDPHMELSVEGDVGRVGDNPEQWLYQSVYGLSLAALLLCCLLKASAMSSLLMRGSRALHDRLLSVVLSKPVMFFDQIESGVLLSLFSKDMDEVDVRYPYFVDVVWQGFVLVISQILLVCVVFPYFTIPAVLLFAVFVLMDVWMNKAVAQVKRVSSALQSPVVDFLSSTVSGLSLIRTYGQQAVFQERFKGHLNNHLAGEILFRLSTCWFTFRMETLAMVAVVVTALITVLTRGSVSPAEAGNALSCIFVVGAFISTFMRLKSEMQARYTSVERIMEYMEGPVEAEIGLLSVPQNWPPHGSITMQNVCLRYGPDKPLVLKDICVEINPAEKIGVVGRTGAGKTSLITALMRLIELESGQIIIDGIDISQIGLFELRAAIAVIPQDPVLFGGTLRHNLDPFDEHTDDMVWDALEKSHLKDKVLKDSKGLMMVVEADGDNFSVGEKQLLCLARALLRRNKILLLDEATASVDLMTDRLIQLTLNEAFAHCTLLTIAHRLDTILSYDRIIVLDAGKILEFDRPEVLRQKEDSMFYSMLGAMTMESS